MKFIWGSKFQKTWTNWAPSLTSSLNEDKKEQKQINSNIESPIVVTNKAMTEAVTRGVL